MNEILKHFNIDETLTKPIYRKRQKIFVSNPDTSKGTIQVKTEPRKFTSVKSVVAKAEDYNFATDLIMLPLTKEKYNYLLVVVDLATNEFDIEPLKTKSPDEVLKAFMTITNRKYLNKPEFSITTDAGKEFLGIFQKYLYQNSILKRTAMVGKHTQNANVERLNKELGRLIMGYLNTQEKKSGKIHREWLKIIPDIRDKLNAFRKTTAPVLPKDGMFNESEDDVKMKLEMFDSGKASKFAVGDLVHHRMYQSLDIHQKREYGVPSRMGDYRWSKLPYEVTHIFSYPAPIYYRYKLDELDNVTFTEDELLKSKETVIKRFIKQFLEERSDINGRKMYKVWYLKERKNKAIFQFADDLTADGLDISDYIKEMKERKRKR